MAVNNTAKTFANMEFPLAMKRQDAFALDPSTVWPTLADAQSYAKTNPTAYVGQLLSAVVSQRAAVGLAPLGAAAVTIASDDEANEMLTEIFGE